MPDDQALKPSLPSEKCRLVCDSTQFKFSSTADLKTDPHIIGQPRGTKAIAFGVGIQSQGYNIFVMGSMGTGRTTAIKNFLQEQAAAKPTPDDWLYVHNFAIPHQPRAISMSAGEGQKFKERMSKLINDLRRDLPQAFDTEAYRDTIDKLQAAFEQKQNELLKTFGEKANAQGFALLKTPSGFAVVPTVDGRQLNTQEFNQFMQQLTPEQQAALESSHQALMNELTTIVGQIHHLERETRQQMKEIDRAVAETAVKHHFTAIKKTYQDDEETSLYLEEVRQDVLTQIDDFAPPVDSENTTEQIDLRRYEVNLLVNNRGTQGAPVIREANPTFHSLFGRIEYEMAGGLAFTHFTNLKCGSLHWANGGYLIINAHELMKHPEAYEALKRALKEEKIFVQPPAQLDQGQVMAKSLDPEPIPLQVKIILLGSVEMYYTLFAADGDFRTLFKVRADFETTMPRDDEHMQEYARFIAGRCHEEHLLHFDTTAVAKVIEYGSRLAEDQQKLSTRFGDIADLIREASYYASAKGSHTTTAADVQEALAERIYRASAMQQQLVENILQETIFIKTSGSVVGQVNGLSVLDTGDYSFGQAGRISARTYMGDDGITNIERETDMSGPIHDKGLLTLEGYFGGTYAQNQPLSLNASITFEQNYTGIDGDSASSTEIYALMSSLSDIPLKQEIAVSGSVNQHGEIQPIGGVNQKIEGFFHLCQARGLTGSQGVVIPASNVNNLMLQEEVITAVAEGKFHIWPITTIDEGIELLTGIPAGKRRDNGSYPEGTVHHAVQQRLLQLAEDLNHFANGS